MVVTEELDAAGCLGFDFNDGSAESASKRLIRTMNHGKKNRLFTYVILKRGGKIVHRK